MRRIRFIAAMVSLTLTAATAAEAQRSMGRPQHATLNLAAGVSAWDLGGTGNSIIFAGRVDYPITPWVLGEGSLATFRTNEQDEGGFNTYLIPEVQLQSQLPRAVAPYLGVGLGAFTNLSRGLADDTDLTASAAAGVRVWNVIPRGVIRAELRLRTIGREGAGRAFETTVGAGWTF